jgi:DNA polymerase III delta' subunit
MSVKKHPILNKWLTAAQLPHALLFAGGLLTTKYSTALELAQWLLCEQGKACQECTACKWVAKLAHPDMLCFPNDDESSIKIDDVRAAIEHLNQSAHQGKYKIVILSPAEAMPLAAMNALLKILEEPPTQSLLILLSQYPSLLLPTIRSRCQRVVFPNETNVDDTLTIKLTQTLNAIIDKKLTPFAAAEQWQKSALSEVLQGLYFCCVTFIKNHVSDLAQSRLFAWYDQINDARSQILHKLNPNQTIVLEHIFYQWMSLHDVS